MRNYQRDPRGVNQTKRRASRLTHTQIPVTHTHTHIHPSNSSIIHYLPRNKHHINNKIVHTIIIHVNTTELKVKLLNHSENDKLLKFDGIFQHIECHASETQIKPQAEGTRNAETEVEARRILGGRMAPQRI